MAKNAQLTKTNLDEKLQFKYVLISYWFWYWTFIANGTLVLSMAWFYWVFYIWDVMAL